MDPDGEAGSLQLAADEANPSHQRWLASRDVVLYTAPMLPVMLLASLVGVHYEHPRQHFTVELPKDWAPVEPANDPAGVIFHRNTNDRLTICTIRAVPIGDATLQDFVLAIAAASQGEPGYTSVASGPTTLAGGVGYRLRFTQFIDPGGQFTKTVEERIAIIDHVGYVVRVEGFTHWFNQRSRDAAQIFKTFAAPGPDGRARPGPLRFLPCPVRDHLGTMAPRPA